MSSREIVKKAIHYKSPERVPIGFIVVDWEKWKNSRTPDEVKKVELLMARITEDVLYIDCHTPEGRAERKTEDGVFYDDWGVGWRNISQKTRFIHPLGDGWNKLDDMKFPDPDSSKCFDKVKAAIAKHKDTYILPTVFFTLFERLWFIRGMENMLIDPLVDYNNFKKLRDKILEYDMRMIDNWIKIKGVDGIFFSDDWGSQKGLLINPNDWRKFYKPCYKELFGKVKSSSMDVWMHLDGNISEIIPDLVEIGLDVYNPVQNQCVDIKWLRKEFGGYLCFNGGVDVQTTLPFGTPNQVKEEVDMIASVLNSPNGGFVMGTSHTILPDTPIENMRALVSVIESYIK